MELSLKASISAELTPENGRQLLRVVYILILKIAVPTTKESLPSQEKLVL